MCAFKDNRYMGGGMFRHVQKHASEGRYMGDGGLNELVPDCW